jgi:hypothetical protein
VEGCRWVTVYTWGNTRAWKRGRPAFIVTTRVGCPPHGGRCFGKPLRAISRFSHQDAQTPPSPLVGEGGLGADRTFEQRCVFWLCNGQSAILSAPTHRTGRCGFQTCPPWRSNAAGNVHRTYFLSALEGEGGRGDEGQRCAGMQNIAHLSQKLYT